MKDFIIKNENEKGFNNFINLIGIESPGLTSSLAISKYVKGLIKCLSKKRATEYDPWLSVGFCLHNINTNLLIEWKEFSSLSDSYDEDSCDKQWALNSRSNYEGHKYGIGSLVKWAKEDNEKLFDMSIFLIFISE